jgi:predicted DNA-binding transcriptional regulator AlpA
MTDIGAPTKRRRSRNPAIVSVSPPPRDYLLRPELLVMVPMSMGSIDALEKRGEFPSRFRLPINRVAWVRAEVEAFMRKCAKQGRVHAKASVE